MRCTNEVLVYYHYNDIIFLLDYPPYYQAYRYHRGDVHQRQTYKTHKMGAKMAGNHVGMFRISHSMGAKSVKSVGLGWVSRQNCRTSGEHLSRHRPISMVQNVGVLSGLILEEYGSSTTVAWGNMPIFRSNKIPDSGLYLTTVCESVIQ